MTDYSVQMNICVRVCKLEEGRPSSSVYAYTYVYA